MLTNHILLTNLVILKSLPVTHLQYIWQHIVASLGQGEVSISEYFIPEFSAPLIPAPPEHSSAVAIITKSSLWRMTSSSTAISYCWGSVCYRAYYQMYILCLWACGRGMKLNKILIIIIIIIIIWYNDVMLFNVMCWYHGIKSKLILYQIYILSIYGT